MKIVFNTKCNYPTTPEGIKQYNDSLSKAMLKVLRKKLSPYELDELMKRYEEVNKMV